MDYKELITLKNLFLAWDEFKIGKQKKLDVLLFERNLENNIFRLYEDLNTKTYKHQGYHTFYIYDPKFRVINKACVRDRVVHHLVYNFLEPIFQPMFIHQSYSCQKGKGIHLALKELFAGFRKLSKNYTRQVWSLKLDIKKFFANIDHGVLLKILNRHIPDENIMWLLTNIVESFETTNPPPAPSTAVEGVGGLPSVATEGIEGRTRVGLPIGNLTSQIFANIYLSELDYFVKHYLKKRYYYRYADDFIFFDTNQIDLRRVESEVAEFVKKQLKLDIHPKKIIYRKFSQGVDFVGYILLPHYSVLRAKTRKRMFKKVRCKLEEYNQGDADELALNQTIQSYLGLLKHCNGYRVDQKLRNEVWLQKTNIDNSPV